MRLGEVRLLEKEGTIQANEEEERGGVKKADVNQDKENFQNRSLSFSLFTLN